VPTIEGVTGPDRSSTDFALAWSAFSGIDTRPGMRLRIHETRGVNDAGLGECGGRLRIATAGDLALLSAWTDVLRRRSRHPGENRFHRRGG
jgi:hypothetical protein